ncbi:DUF4834 family protein [Xylanibacter muris]|uniref:DUF4834 family protein n=1 Tax=Xylanibacter muris TaxID=2736290 RepID=A0ABX2AL23_9BACT|nr:DUF4834 family protein [Xylanibacter muris]NPD91898.1 DUF4834 family protein [Xylanibacter muris]
MLKGLLFLLVIFIVIIAVVMVIVFSLIFKGIRMFRKMTHGNPGSPFTSEGFGHDSRNSQDKASWTTGNGETLIDTRDTKHAGRKIFSADDGEYVDFKEN